MVRMLEVGKRSVEKGRSKGLHSHVRTTVEPKGTDTHRLLASRPDMDSIHSYASVHIHPSREFLMF